MKNPAFILVSILTLGFSVVSAETVVAPTPAQVVLQFSQSIAPEPAVPGGCCATMKAAQGARPGMTPQGNKTGCCCSRTTAR